MGIVERETQLYGLPAFFILGSGKEGKMNNVNLQKLMDRAGKMALHNIWGENSYKINMAILRIDPDNCAACTRLAKYYKLDDNIDEARNMYSRVLKIDPNHRGAINNLNEMEKEQNENEAVNKIHTIGDLLKEGQSSMVKGRYRMAVKLFTKAFESEPSLKHAVCLAYACEKTGRYDRIETIYRQLIGDNSIQNHIEAIENEFKALRSNANIRSGKESDNKT